MSEQTRVALRGPGNPETPYLVVYTVAGETVQIVTVLHSARKWPR